MRAYLLFKSAPQEDSWSRVIKREREIMWRGMGYTFKAVFYSSLVGEGPGGGGGKFSLHYGH